MDKRSLLTLPAGRFRSSRERAASAGNKSLLLLFFRKEDLSLACMGFTPPMTQSQLSAIRFSTLNLLESEQFDASIAMWRLGPAKLGSEQIDPHIFRRTLHCAAFDGPHPSLYCTPGR
jgi:hypothetical protein